MRTLILTPTLAVLLSAAAAPGEGPAAPKDAAVNPEYLRQGLLRWKEKRLVKRRDSEAWNKIMTEPQKRTAQ